MNAPRRPLLLLIAGPNGAGKTTFYQRNLAELGLPFINADELALQRWPQAPGEHAYEAARLAQEIRQQHLAERRSFVAETVFSHPSKIELVREGSAEGLRCACDLRPPS